jgi:hypothetical protein
LFQGRFKSIVVDRDAYLLELCRYVVLNPVRAGMVEQPEEYVWSSYGATAGMSPGPVFLAVDWVLSQFAAERDEARRLYKEFVSAGIGGGQVWAELKSQCILGGTKFLEKIEPALKNKSMLKEIPRCQRLISRPSLDELLSPLGSFEKIERDELLKKAHLEHGYSFAQIGRHVGLHYATVSRVVRGK